MQKVCKKVFVDKRKQFNIEEHRKATDASGKGLEEDNYGMKRRKPPAKAPPPKMEAPVGKMPKWKAQSLMFRQAMQAANGGPSKGGGGSNFNPSYEPS